MVTWNLVKLKHITSKIGSGATPRGGKEAYKDEGITLIRSLNIYDFFFDYSGLAYIDDKQAKELSNVEVEPEDILLNITGASVARCCIVPEKLLPARVNQHVSIIRVKPELANAHFVLYVINSPTYKRHLLSLAQGGATREALTKTTIEEFQIPLPPIETQRRIADILSAYDELIENNNQRIKALEQAAQDLYQEWFVHFRFPNHENVPMVESELGMIPQGWEVRKLGSIAEINARSIGKNPPQEIEYVDIASVSTGRIDATQLMAFDEAPSRARRVVQHGDVIWATVRPNRRSYALIIDPSENLIVSTGFAVLSSVKVPYSYLYHAVTTNGFAEYLTNHATGSAYPAVNAGDFAQAKILFPDLELMQRFHEVAADLYQEKVLLERKNHLLHEARDLLLPRLVSGELDVSEVEMEKLSSE